MIHRRSAVEKLAKSFTEHHGDLPSVYRTLVELSEAWEQPLAKYKTPTDYIYSTHRALDLPVAATRRGLAAFELLGQRNFTPGSPAGWPDRSADWDGASALMKRIEWADRHRSACRHASQRRRNRASNAGRKSERRNWNVHRPRGERHAGADVAAHARQSSAPLRARGPL